MMRNIIRFIAIHVPFSFIYIVAIWFACGVIENLEWISIASKDVIPIIGPNGGLLVVAVYIFVVIVLIRRRSLRIRRSINLLMIILSAALAFVFLKDVSCWQEVMYCTLYLIGTVCFRLGVIFWDDSRLYIYQGESRFDSDDPVGETELTIMQKKALDKMIRTIDGRRSDDSLNIALIAAWGSGKTSIINGMIEHFQKRNKGENEYFILRVNTLTFDKVVNVVDYVDDYIDTLLKRYCVTVNSFFEGVSYLAALSNFLEDNRIGVIKKAVENISRKGNFIDLEFRKIHFTKQVQKLLKVSGKKNIVLVIDDADRGDIQEKIIRLLSEFSAIKGIISVVLLSDKYDVDYRPGRNMVEEELVQRDRVDGFDKYLHLRIRLEDSNRIEYEASIKKHVVDAYKRCELIGNERTYMDYPYHLKRSLFDSHAGYQTHFLDDNNFGQISRRTILFDLFFRNLSNTDIGFGEYFETIVMNYYRNSEEVMLYNEIITSLPEEEKMVLMHQMHFFIDGYKEFPMDNIDWLSSINNMAHQMRNSLLFLMDSLKNNESKKILKAGMVKDIFELNHLIFNSRFKPPIEVSEQHMPSSKFFNTQFTSTIYILFGKEVDSINEYLRRGQFDLVSNLLKEKYRNLSQFAGMSELLLDFMKYLRGIMNNYRTFKIQLRESVILNMNYLDYLLENWTTKGEIINRIHEINKPFPFADEVNIGLGSLKDCICNILCAEYFADIAKQLPAVHGDNMPMRRVWISKNENFIVVSQRWNSQTDYYIFDADQKLLEDVPTELLDRVKKEGALFNL